MPSQLSEISDAIAASGRARRRRIHIVVEDMDGNKVNEVEMNKSDHETHLIIYGIKEHLDVAIPIWQKLWSCEWSKG